MAEKVGYNYQSRVWDDWSEDPTKAAAIQAIRSCQARVGYSWRFSQEVAGGLAQILVFPSFLFIGSGGSALLKSF